MTMNVDLAGNTLIVENLRTGATTTGQPGTAVSGVTSTAQTLAGKKTFTDGINSKQSVASVHDTTPSAAELTGTFGAPASLGRGFIATVDDNDGDTNGYIVWTSDASWYFLKGTKAT